MKSTTYKNKRSPIKAKSKKEKYDMQNRCISIIHGVFLLVATYYYVFHVEYDYNNPNTHFESFITAISLSYFIHDVVMMAIFGILDSAMSIHHGVCIFGYSYMIFMGYGGPVEVTGMWYAEVSNPAMHG